MWWTPPDAGDRRGGSAAWPASTGTVAAVAWELDLFLQSLTSVGPATATLNSVPGESLSLADGGEK